MLDRDSNRLYYRNCWRGFENLNSISPDEQSPEPEPLIEDRINIHAFTIPRGGRLLCLGADLLNPAELYEFRSDSSGFIQLTDSNPWRKDYLWAPTEVLWVPTRDGKSEIQVWLTHPPEMEEGRKYPLVLDIHGGPVVQLCIGILA